MSESPYHESFYSVSSRDESDQDEIYAEDERDDRVVHCLIRTVEQYVLYDRLTMDKKEAKEQLITLQRTHDDHMHDIQRYQNLGDEVLDSLITLATEQMTNASTELQQWTKKLQQTEEMLNAAKLRRALLVAELYDNAEQFAQRNIVEGATIALDIDISFDRNLARLKARANFTKSSEISLKATRQDVLDANQEVVAADGDPATTRENILAVRARRKRALEIARREEAMQKRRKKAQLAREVAFFNGGVHDMLIDSGILPRLETPAPSPSAGSVSEIAKRPREHGGDEPADMSPPHPKRQALLDARLKAYQVQNHLAVLRSEYVRDLADILLVRPLTKEFYHEAFAEVHDGKSFEELEDALLEELQQADAACSLAWREAIKANVTDLPPSPVELGARRQDGYAESENTERRAATKEWIDEIQPSVRKWGRGVARAGSPLSPSEPPSRTVIGKRKIPPGDVPDLDEPDRAEHWEQPKRRLERYEANRPEYNTRFLLQDTKRQKLEHGKTKKGWRCALQ